DDLGGKGIMDCSDEMALKIFDLQTYKLLFSIAANKIEKYSMRCFVSCIPKCRMGKHLHFGNLVSRGWVYSQSL
ncbi:hypothetical protein ABTG52_09440, partial [Acinetobacter baumannii]